MELKNFERAKEIIEKVKTLSDHKTKISESTEIMLVTKNRAQYHIKDIKKIGDEKFNKRFDDIENTFIALLETLLTEHTNELEKEFKSL